MTSLLPSLYLPLSLSPPRAELYPIFSYIFIYSGRFKESPPDPYDPCSGERNRKTKIGKEKPLN
jgi:hypothetical protein